MWVASVAELVDAADSKSVVRWDVLVRFRPGAPRVLKIQSVNQAVKNGK